MSREAFGKSLSLFDPVKDVFNHGLNLGPPRELLTNRQATIQGQPGVNQRREFLGKEHDVLGADAAESQTQVQLKILDSLSSRDLERGHPHALETNCYGLVRNIVERPLDNAPVLSYGFIEECGHVWIQLARR